MIASMAVLTILSACKNGPAEVLPDNYGQVTSLTAPADGVSVSMDLVEKLQFSWMKAVGAKDASYELMFVAEGGSFASPLKTFQSGENTLLLSKEDVNALFEAAKVDNTATLSWTVASITAERGRQVCSGARKLVLTYEAIPVPVEELLAPADAYTVVLSKTEGVDFTWAAPLYLGEEPLSYELLLSTGGFDEPQLTVPASSLSARVTKDQLQALWVAAAGEDAESLDVNWTVRTLEGDNKWLSTAVRKIVLVPDIVLPGAGVAVTLEGETTDAGEAVSYIVKDEYYASTDANVAEVAPFNADVYNYEVYAKLSAGKKVYLKAGDILMTISGDLLTTILSADAATAPVDEDGIYRIRFQLPEGNVVIQKVESVGIFYSAKGTDSKVLLNYEGKGVWKLSNFVFRWTSMGSWNDERYKFSMVIDGTEQQFGRFNGSDGRPNASTEANYWYLAPAVVNQWDPGFKMPDQWVDFDKNERWTATLMLYMNADKGHYTHEFVDPVDHAEASPADPTDGSVALYIGGEGSEAGQQFTWIGEGYYDSDAKAANPSFDPAEGLYGYYEIYTKLEAGKSYFFYTENYKYNPTTLEQAADEAAAGVEVTEGGIYRIRVDLDGKRVGLKKIEKFLMAYEWNRQDPNWQWEFTYAGKGTWKIDDFKVAHHDWDKPARYNFHMLFGDFADRQVWGRNQNLDGQPAADAAQSVFDLQPRETREWPGREMKFPVNVWDNDNSGRYTVDITVYFNTEKGHYTHTFTDIKDTVQ